MKSLPDFWETVLPDQADDVLEFDEAWGFLLKKVNKRWLWTVMCQRRCQIIAFMIGGRSPDLSAFVEQHPRAIAYLHLL